MYQLITTLFKVYELIVLARVLLSWIPAKRTHPVIDWIYRLTDPVLAPIRAILPTTRMGFDLSPLILLLVLSLLQRALLSLIFSF